MKQTRVRGPRLQGPMAASGASVDPQVSKRARTQRSAEPWHQLCATRNPDPGLKHASSGAAVPRQGLSRLCSRSRECSMWAHNNLCSLVGGQPGRRRRNKYPNPREVGPGVRERWALQVRACPKECRAARARSPSSRRRSQPQAPLLGTLGNLPQVYVACWCESMDSAVSVVGARVGGSEMRRGCKWHAL